MPQATINDVAEHAQVSRSTVSRVLNNQRYVAPEVRDRVLNAMQVLGYQPNRAARRLRASQGDLLGLIIPDIQNALFLSLVRAVEDLAYAHQMNVILCNTDDNREKQKTYLDVMQAQQAAGLIVGPTHPKDAHVLAPVQDAGIPIVLVDREITGFEADTVIVDNYRGAQLAISHLIGLRYKRIAILAGPQDLTPGRERLQGYYDALREGGVEVANELVKIGTFKADSARELTYELMQGANPPDAIFASNNLMALGCMHALHEMNVDIPNEVALVSFDDMPWAEDLYPPLTAIAQPSYELGYQALELLLNRMNRPDMPYRKIILQPQLIIRKSCGAHR
jgi:DNA-binding LacI/PurR family transcriptional regulator